MRALPSLLLAGAVGLGGLVLTPGTAEADGGWRGRDYYRYYLYWCLGLWLVWLALKNTFLTNALED